MKKLLVLGLSAAMLFGVAAVSMAAATINGDFRYNMYEDESASDNSYADTDLRLRVTGDLSDTVQATANLRWVQDSLTSGDGVSSKLDEFLVTAKEPWGTVKMGHYEYKFTPSRVELKSGHYHVWEKSDATFEVDIPVAEGLTFDAIVQPYAENAQDDGAYGVALNYKAEKWGAKFTYANFLGDTTADKIYTGDDDNNLMAFDVYYNLNADMTVFVAAVDFSANDKKYSTVAGGGCNSKGNFYDQYGIDGIDPVIGFKYNNVAGVKNWFASAEYAINQRYEDSDDEYNEYFLKTTYKLVNGIGLELFYCPVGDGLDKTQLRLRYQF
jgi:hypothetical protein